MGERGRKHFATGATETVVCYQGRGYLRQSGSGTCSQASQNRWATNTIQSPTWQRQVGPLPWPPPGDQGRNGNPERKDSFLLEFLFLKHLLQNHRRAGGSVLVKYMHLWNPIQPIRISWSPTWEFENALYSVMHD